MTSLDNMIMHIYTITMIHAHTYNTPNLPTNIVGFGGFDSSTILSLRGEIPCP